MVQRIINMTESLHVTLGDTTMFDTIQNRVMIAYVGAATLVALLAAIY